MPHGTREVEWGWAVARGADEFYVEHVKWEDPLRHPEGVAQGEQTWDVTLCVGVGGGVLKPCEGVGLRNHFPQQPSECLVQHVTSLGLSQGPNTKSRLIMLSRNVPYLSSEFSKGVQHHLVIANKNK